MDEEYHFLEETLSLFKDLENELVNHKIENEFQASKDLVQNLIQKKFELRKNVEEDCFQKLTKECQYFEDLATTTDKEICKKYDKQLYSLREARQREQKKLHSESNILEEITNKMNFLVLNQKDLGEKEVDLKQKQNVDIERDRATFKLLSNTLKIKWDYTCPKERVQGFVSGKHPVPFFVDKKEHDTYYTANYLWDLIELS